MSIISHNLWSDLNMEDIRINNHVVGWLNLVDQNTVFLYNYNMHSWLLQSTRNLLVGYIKGCAIGSTEVWKGKLRALTGTNHNIPK